MEHSAEGVVQEWSAEEGVGVLASAETPGGCWVGWGALSAAGFGAQGPTGLTVGARVSFDFVVVEQDGYAYAATRVWPSGGQFVGLPVTVDGGRAFRSSVTFDDDDDDADADAGDGPRSPGPGTVIYSGRYEPLDGTGWATATDS